MSKKLICLCMVLWAADAAAQAPYFQGKTIRVIVGYPAGSAHDIWARIIAPHLTKQIPGNPATVVQIMPGAGSMTATNYIAGVSKPDGLTVGSMGAALVANAVLGEPGVQYDIDKFIYLGTPDSAQHYLFVTHRDAGMSSIEKLRSAPGVRIGGQSVGHPV